MLDTSLLSSIAKQMMSAGEVEVEGKWLPVRRTSRQGLRTVTFTIGGREYAAIEQNPEKPSRWGELAADTQLGSVPVTVVGQPDFLILDGDGYMIRDSKTTTLRWRSTSPITIS
jgi:hypothetical protein